MRGIPSWGNLAGPPIRYANKIDSRDRDRRKHNGYVKLRLGHSTGRSYLIPDVLIGVSGARYFLPSFFGPPLLAFHVGAGRHRADFSMDVGPPTATQLARLILTVHSDDRVLTYEDGAQLYKCTYEGPRTIARYATGHCRPAPGGDFVLDVFHTPATAAKIRASGELWSSSWNLAGTRKLGNIAYGYFTPLPRIKAEEDLQRIAMASRGAIQLQTTSDRMLEEVLRLEVYRGDTRDRTSSILFEVPSGIIAPPHLYLHPSAGGEPAYHEVVGPEIVRVGVNPTSVLPLSGREIRPRPGDLKRFDYVVLGDTSTVAGLAAPYDEEDTREVTHLERLDKGLDLFEFWLAHQNTNVVAGRVFEERIVAPR